MTWAARAAGTTAQRDARAPRLRAYGAAVASGFTRLGSSGAVWGAATVAWLVVFTTWFEAGAFFAAGDTAPFMRRGVIAEFGALWTHENSGAGGPTYSLLRAPEVALIELAHLLGGGEALAQRLLFATMWGFAALGGATLAARFTERRWVILAAGLSTAFNLRFLSHLPNFLPVVAAGSLGLLTAYFIDAARGRDGRWLSAALATVPLAYVARNPPTTAVVIPYLALLPVVAAGLSTSGRAGVRACLRFGAKVAAAALPLAVWWIVPQLLAITNAVHSSAVGATTNVEDWAWTHRNSTLANIVTLRNSWSWPLVRYHGAAAEALSSPAFAWLSWLLPAAFCAAPLLCHGRRRRAASWAAVMYIPLVVVAKGLHAPFGWFNRALYDHVPGFWLLREPMSKVSMFIVLLLVVGVAVTLDGLAGRLPAVQGIGMRRATAGAACLLSLGPLVFVWPMLNGAVTHDSQPGWNEQVTVPQAWYWLADAINTSPRAGKAVVMPFIDFHQMPTTWDYYGLDTLARGMIDRPVISRSPQGYITDTPDYDDLLHTFEDALVSGDSRAVVPMLQRLGASHVLVRNDFDEDSPVRPIHVADPDRLAATLAQTPGLTQIAQTSQGIVFELTGEPTGPVQVFGAVLNASAAQADDLAMLAADAPGAAIATGKLGAGTATGTSWVGAFAAGSVFDNPAPGAYQVSLHHRSGRTFRVHPEGTTVVFDDITNHFIGGAQLPSPPPWVLDAGAPTIGLRHGKEFVSLQDGPVTITLGAGEEVEAVAPAGPPLPISLGDVADCKQRDGRGLDEVGIGSAEGPVQDRYVVELRATAHSACRSAELPGVTAGSVLQVRMQGRSLGGEPVRACLWMFGLDRCIALDFGPGGAAADPAAWQQVDQIVEVPKGTTGARLYLYSDGGPGEQIETVAQYTVPSVVELRSGANAAPPLVTQSSVELPAGQLALSETADGPARTVARSAWSPVKDCRKTDGQTMEQAGLSATLSDDPEATVRLTAKAHTACVSADLAGVRPGDQLLVTLEHRSEAGNPARICLYDSAERRCAKLTSNGEAVDTLPSSPSWRTTTLTAEVPASLLPGKVSASPDGRYRLYVYADGTASGTIAEYRAVNLVPAGDRVSITAAAQAAAPLMRWSSSSVNHYRVAVSEVQAPFVVALSETSAPGWRLTGLPAGATARRIELDNYRNGWLVDLASAKTTTANLEIRYTPDTWVHWAVVVSAVAFVTASAVGLWGWRRRLARSRTAGAAALPGPLPGDA